MISIFLQYFTETIESFEKSSEEHLTEVRHWISAHTSILNALLANPTSLSDESAYVISLITQNNLSTMTLVSPERSIQISQGKI